MSSSSPAPLRSCSCLVALFFFLTLLPPGRARAQQEMDAARPDIRIQFVGDILLEASWQDAPPPPASLFARVQRILRAADLVIANLEEPLTDHRDRTPHKNPRAVKRGEDFIFRASSPDAAAALRAAGIDIAALANNHTMDYTEQGLLDTLDRLREAGIVAVGGGRDLSEADSVRVVEVKGIRIGVVSMSDVVPKHYWATPDRPGISPAKYVHRVTSVVKRARPQVDVLLVAFHWGPMFVSRPTERMQEWARAAVEAGADAVLGSHPHVLQGVGCIGGAPVIYSAGNFVFPTKNPMGLRSAIFELELTGKMVKRVRILPVQLGLNGRPGPAPRAMAADILKEMETLSTELGATFDEGAAACSR